MRISSAPRPSLPPASPDFAEAIITNAGLGLREQTFDMATSGAVLDVTDKIGDQGSLGPVTILDQAVESYIAAMYAGTSARVAGEEGMSSWDDNQEPEIIVHTDPIDGTQLTIEHFQAIAAWARARRAQPNTPFPTCGSMISMGAEHVGSRALDWGVIAAPFLEVPGPVRWVGGRNQQPYRREPFDTITYPLARAETLDVPPTGGIVMAASDRSERLFREPLEAAGFRVIGYRSAVAGAMSLIDPTVYDRFGTESRNDTPIVGTIMRSPKNWDVAGVIALANALGHTVSDMQGQARSFEPGTETGVIFGASADVHRAILRAVMPRS